MRELYSAGSGARPAVPDPSLLRITLPGMYWSGGSASDGSEDCGVGPWGMSTPGGINPPGGGYVGSLGHYLASDLPVSLRGTVGQWFYPASESYAGEREIRTTNPDHSRESPLV